MYKLMNLARYKTILGIAFIAIFALFATPAFATIGVACATDLECAAAAGAKPTGERCVAGKCAGTFGVGEIKDTKLALGGSEDDDSLIKTITQLINVALGLLGIVAVVIILIGGFKWMTAGGNDEQVGEARKWIFSGIIGLAIIMSAWAIAQFVIVNLGTATGADGY